jgi:DNA-binding transcriptional regulator GbsR (MarR family)
MPAVKAERGPRRRPRIAPPHPFVERLALALETDGFPRIAGRIFGLLILSDGEMSLDDIAEAVGASKASASVNTRILGQRGLIERVSRTGDRRDYYLISTDLFVRTMEQRLARWDRVRSVIGDGLADSTLPTQARTRLREFESASESVREVLEAALAKLRTRRKRS